MKRLLVTGSRTWDGGALLAFQLGVAIGELSKDGEPVTIVHGGAVGADAFAGAIAALYGYPEEVHPVVWRQHGVYNPQAGRYRNQVMVDLGADMCLAFIRNGSTGATHCAQIAEDAGIPVRIFRE